MSTQSASHVSFDRPWVTLSAWVNAWLDYPTMLRRAATTLLDTLLQREGTMDQEGDWSADRIAITTDGLACRITLRDPDHPDSDRLSERIECLLLRTSLEALARDPFLAERHPLGKRLLFPSGTSDSLSGCAIFEELEILANARRFDVLKERLAYLRDALRGTNGTVPDLAALTTLDADLPLREHPAIGGDVFLDVPEIETAGRIGNQTIHQAVSDESPSRTETDPGGSRRMPRHSAQSVPIDHLLMVRSLPPQAVALLRDSYGFETAEQLRDHFPSNLPEDWQNQMARWLLRAGAPLARDLCGWHADVSRKRLRSPGFDPDSGPKSP